MIVIEFWVLGLVVVRCVIEGTNGFGREKTDLGNGCNEKGAFTAFDCYNNKGRLINVIDNDFNTMI